jgi:hypothetical protein
LHIEFLLFPLRIFFIDKKIKKYSTLYTAHSLSAILGQGDEDKEEGGTPFGPATLFEQRQRQ